MENLDESTAKQVKSENDAKPRSKPATVERPRRWMIVKIVLTVLSAIVIPIVVVLLCICT